jgi:hypothetical protein
MHPAGSQVWLSTTAGELLAVVIDVQEHPAPPVYVVEVDGGPRVLVTDRHLRPVEPVIVPAG